MMLVFAVEICLEQFSFSLAWTTTAAEEGVWIPPNRDLIVKISGLGNCLSG